MCIDFKTGDGSVGWQEHAPFDRITVAAAPVTIPRLLLEQLKPGGRMVIPLGPENEQQLTLVTKSPDGEIETQPMLQVSFAPLILSH